MKSSASEKIIDLEVVSVAPAATNHKTFNPELLTRLKAYSDTNKLSLNQLGLQLAAHPSAISKYLNGKPEGDVNRLEASIEDLLKNASSRVIEKKEEFFHTNITDTIFTAFNTIRHDIDFGLLTGDAGIGKTTAIQMYLAKNPLAINVYLHARARNALSVERLIASEIDIARWDRRMPLFDFICQRLKGSNRLLIVDNGQRLSRGGLDLLFDLHDLAEIPVCILGNPEELYPKISRNDQMFSRVGYKRDLNLIDNPLAPCKAMVEKYAPSFKNHFAIVAKTVNEKGHLRFLKKLLKKMEVLVNDPEFKGKYKPEHLYKQAILSAEEFLITDPSKIK
ncbi:MAG: hypothetical protein ABS95_02520 [Verrucomicrobia bacterium SCN 57-15]|nr:MAG: hypothetical protein ABS95_02520 [Verrucomicrobia bacterium SCN 57-15]